MTRTTRDRRNRAHRVGLLALMVLLLGTGPASSHGLLISSSPEDGALVATSPTTISLTFHDELGQRGYAEVWAPDGSAVKVLDMVKDFNTTLVTLEPSGQRGLYTARYRVESFDGLPVEGSIHWTATAGGQVKQVVPHEVGRDGSNTSRFLWGILAAVLPVVLLVVWLRPAATRRRDDKNDA